MADLKIDIVANASNALKGIDAVIDSTNKLRNAVAKSGNQDVGGVVSADTTKAAKAYTERLKRIIALSGDYNNDIKAAQKLVRTLTGEYQKLATVTNTPVMNDYFSQGIKEAREFVDQLEKAAEAQRKLKAQAAAQSSFKATWAEAKGQQKGYGDNQAFMRLIGDEAGLAKLKLDEYENALRNVIKLEGEGSSKAKDLAAQYKKQQDVLSKLSSTTTKFSVRVTNLIKSFVSAQAIVYLVQKSFYLLTDGIRAASEAAAEAEETANLFNTTFSNIATTANGVANAMSSALGISTAAAQQALGTFGDLAMGYGQTQSAALEFAESAVTLGLDLISFKNITGDTTQILQALASGLVGNYENFRKWGIIVTMTEVNARLAAKVYDKLTGSALQFAKIQETLAIVQEKSANAQGDMEKTLDSTANVTRRVTEANKELLANIGSGINQVLTPLKLMWLDIAESINKAQKAQELYNAGQKNIGVYDIHNNKEDRRDFNSAVRGAKGVSRGVSMTPYITDEDKFITSMNEIMRIYEASATDVFKTLQGYGIEYSKSIADSIIAIDKLAKAEREEEKLLDERRGTLEDLTASAENYFAALQKIQGVAITTGLEKFHHEGNIESIIASGASLEKAKDEIAARIREGVLEGFSSLKDASWENYISPIDLVFGKTDEVDGLTNKLDSIYSMYEEINNYAITSGADYTDILSAVASYYKEIQGSIEAITAEEERRANIKAIQGGMQDRLYDLNRQTAQLGMSDREKALDEISRQYTESLKSLNAESSTYMNELSNLTAYTEALKDATNNYYDALDKKDAEEEKRGTFTDALENLRNIREDAQGQLITSGMTERETALYELLGVFKEVMAALDPNSSTYAEDQAEAAQLFKEASKDMNAYYNDMEKQAKAEAEKNASSAFTGVTDATGRQQTFQLPWQAELDSAIGVFSSAFNDWAELYIEAGHTQAEVDAEYSKQLERLKKNQVADSYAKAGNTAFAGLGELAELINAVSSFASGAGAGNLVTMLASLATQTEAFAKASSILTDSVLPVLNAFLEPLIPVLETLAEIIGTLLYAALNPLYEMMLSIGTILSTVLGLLQPVLTLLMQISDLVGDFLYPIFQGITLIFQSLMEPLMGLFQIVADILMPILTPFIALLKTLATALIYVYAAFNTAIQFVVDCLQWVAGWIMKGILRVVNGVIDLLNMIPFVNIKKKDTSKYDKWAATNPFDEAEKNWNKAIGLLDEINKSNMEIADNTESQDVDLSVYEDLLSGGIISANEYMAMVNKALGKGYWDPVDYIAAENGSYMDYRGTGQSVNVSYGDTTIVINGEGLDAEDIANTIYRKLQERDRAGAAVFATY